MKNRPVIYALIAIVLLAGLYFLTKPTQQPEAPTTTDQSTQDTTPVPVTSEPTIKTFTLDIKNKKLVSGSETIQVIEGDQVKIMVTSDQAEELHLHGYDVSVDLEAGQPAELAFTATVTGRFIFELEHSKTDLGAVEVQPK